LRTDPIESKAILPYFSAIVPEVAMTMLTVTAKGQVTLKKELLQHLGVKPGQKIEVDTLPDRQLALKAAPRKGSWEEIYGLLADKTEKVATIEEMNEAIRQGWASQR
jgi:bifunctional DNA-binding transcriptional regulator/antitoxin component of YhaV-PrlF toxin-antitoxin module